MHALSQYNVAMLTLGFLLLATQVLATCKLRAGDPGWPSSKEWQNLNESISGRLIAVTEAPGAVCFKTEANYSPDSCQALQTQWTSSSFHRNSPATVDFHDDTCSPFRTNSTCSVEGYPAYVVAAEKVSDVQRAINFARRTGVRLILKGTGHDYLGRSSGARSLSIWTNGFKGIDIGTGTAKIMAGMTVKEILTAASDHNITIVTGSDAGVGIGGWLTGAGHGPLSAKYGMGADQVLEMEVVTTSGQHLTINQHKYSDLFWAMRGGGASTYAVMISATVKTYPDIPAVILSHNYTTTSESEDFWNMLVEYHRNIPHLSDSGVMGYYFASANISQVLPGSPDVGFVITSFIVPEKSVSAAQAIMLKMEKKFRFTNFTRAAIAVPSFSKAWVQNPPGTVGTDSRLASRFLDKKALTDPGLKTALQKAMPKENVRVLLGNLVAGKVKVDNAVLPAWRSAYSHLIIPVVWNSEQEKIIKARELQEHLQALKAIAPNTGAYMSESDPSDPDWQRSFYGPNYQRLLAIKKKWDPQGVFWCRICVGNELWALTGGDAIGQDAGRICRR